MRYVFLFIFVWLAFAFFDSPFSGENITAYTVRETNREAADEHLPRYITRATTEYRVASDKVTSKTGPFVSELSNCILFDKRNWKCTYDDESAVVGFRQGEYFEISNLEKFPHLDGFYDGISVGRFRYIMVDCRWDWEDGPLQMIACIFRPFLT